MWKKPVARKLVHDFFADPDEVIVCKDSDGATYMTDQRALVHVNSRAFPARWYMNLDEGLYKVRAAGDPVPVADITDHHRAVVLGFWDKLAHVSDWRPVEPTPWRRDAFMRLLIRHDTRGDRAIFASYDRIEAFTSAGHPATTSASPNPPENRPSRSASPPKAPTASSTTSSATSHRWNSTAPSADPS